MYSSLLYRQQMLAKNACECCRPRLLMLTEPSSFTHCRDQADDKLVTYKHHHLTFIAP